MAGIAKSATVAVIGAGTMGAGIAQVAAAAGHRVLLFDAVEGAAGQAKARVAAALATLEQKGRITGENCARAVGGLHAASDLEELRDADLIVEAVVEKLDIKQALFRRLEDIAPPQAIFATNTSSISITAIGSALADPGRLAGFHFFNPAPVMKLVEIVSGLATRPRIVETLAATARAWGKIAVNARSTPGFIVNRVARPYYGEALRLMEEQVAEPATLDLIYTKSGGFQMGPFALMDMIGHDVNFAVTCSVYDALFGDPRYKPALSQQELVAAGWLGRKSGRGFYRYDDQEPPVAAAICPTYSAPCAIDLLGDGPDLAGLAALCRSRNIQVAESVGPGLLQVEDVFIARTDGRSATRRVADGAPANLVLFDLTFDIERSELVALAQADQASSLAIERAAALFQALGKAVVIIKDHPGMVMLRTLSLLIDEAANAVQTRIAAAADVEVAIQAGVNYPRGLLDWGDSVGAEIVVAALDHAYSASGDPRYRVGDWLRRCATTGASLSRYGYTG